jgi:pimeloyl-ACP methyl ester carboxylesterase
MTTPALLPRPTKSTNVRSRETARLPLRLAFAALGAVAPGLAARAGERLFLTPQRGAERRDRQPLARADAFLVPSGREVLRAWRVGEGPAVLLAHGWSGRADQLAPFVEPLVAAGCAAVLFDAPAHGASTGRLTSGIGFAEAITAVAAAVGARAAIAHSLGGSGLAWAVANGLPLDAAVIVAAPRGPTDYFHRFCEALRLPPGVRDATRARLQRRLGLTLEDFDLARRVSATPLLVLHDRDDREVPWSDGDAIARAWPGAALVSTRGLGHRRILRDAGVTARASAFVTDRLARCACGRLASGAGSPARCAQCTLERDLFHAPSRWPEA